MFGLGESSGVPERRRRALERAKEAIFYWIIRGLRFLHPNWLRGVFRRQYDRALQPVLRALGEVEYAAVCRQAMLSTCLPTDDEIRKRMLIASLPKAPQHVLTSALKNHLLDYDSTPAAAGCHIPTAYIGAAVPTADLTRFRRHTPQLVTAQTLGSGHFSPLLVPDQINTMLQTLRDVYTPD